MTCPLLCSKPYINKPPREYAVCFFQLNSTLTLSQLEEPINCGAFGTKAQTINSADYRWWRIYEQEKVTCLSCSRKLPTLSPQGAKSLNSDRFALQFSTGQLHNTRKALHNIRKCLVFMRTKSFSLSTLIIIHVT